MYGDMALDLAPAGMMTIDERVGDVTMRAMTAGWHDGRTAECDDRRRDRRGRRTDEQVDERAESGRYGMDEVRRGGATPKRRRRSPGRGVAERRRLLSANDGPNAMRSGRIRVQGLLK